MEQAEALYHRIADSIPDATKGKMFGALCIKAPNGKAAAMYHKGDMIFKLEGKDEQEALSLDGAKTFDPMDGRPMRGWIQVPYRYAEQWPALAEKAMAYVRTIQK